MSAEREIFCYWLIASPSQASRKERRLSSIFRAFLNTLFPTGEFSHAPMRPFDWPSPFIAETGYHGLPGPVRQYR